jgi:hypothetical protein
MALRLQTQDTYVQPRFTEQFRSQPQEERKMKIAKLIAAVAAALALCGPAHAWDYYVGSAQVQWIETSYMPSAIVFTIDVAAGSCAAGTSLHWNPANADNAKAVFAALVAARASGTQIRLYGLNAGCVISNVYFG